jgi:serine O-acetyltransferase
VIGAGAKVLGAITIGEDSRIGANAVVVRNVPPNSVVVGIPGQVIRRKNHPPSSDRPDMDHTTLPDVVGHTVQQLLRRVTALEHELHIEGKDAHTSSAPEWQWEGKDFTI